VVPSTFRCCNGFACFLLFFLFVFPLFEISATARGERRGAPARENLSSLQKGPALYMHFVELNVF
jgi:hypothetical protein